MASRMTKAETEKLFGPVRRWKEGDILFAENDWISGAFVVTDDREKIGQLGLHPYGADQMCGIMAQTPQARA